MCVWGCSQHHWSSGWQTMCHFAVREPINQPFTTSLAQKKRRWSVMDVHHGTDVLQSTFFNSHIHHHSDSYTRLPGAASGFPLFALLLLFFSLFLYPFFLFLHQTFSFSIKLLPFFINVSSFCSCGFVFAYPPTSIFLPLFLCLSHSVSSLTLWASLIIYEHLLFWYFMHVFPDIFIVHCVSVYNTICSKCSLEVMNKLYGLWTLPAMSSCPLLC